MDRNFPMCGRQITTSCVYLPTDNVFEYLVEGLKKSIMVKGTDWNIYGEGCICEVQCYLANTYGGPPERFTQQQKFTDIYLIQLPPEINREDVVRDGREWGRASGWEMEIWDISKDANFQQKQFRVNVKITRFPPEFWHPCFVKMVMAQLGDTVEINEENMWGADRKEINVTVNCIDPRRIPYSSVLPYGDVWKECYFEVAAWDYICDVPPAARYTPANYEEARSSLIAAHDKLVRFLEKFE